MSQQKLKLFITIALGLFLLLDLSLSAVHYYQLSIDGDLIKVGLPILWYDDVMADPFGFKAVLEGKTYSGAGRFMSHQMTFWWFHYMYEWIFQFVKNPVVSIYCMTTGIAMLVHVLYLWLSVKYVLINQKKTILKVLLVAGLATIFIQYGHFYHSIGIIDRSSSYIFFYALPICLLLLYLFPFYKAYHTGLFHLSIGRHFIWILLALVLAFSSPLMQPVIFVISFMTGLAMLHPASEKLRQTLRSSHIYPHLLFFLCLCVYAFYVSKFNTENTGTHSLMERYALWLQGLKGMWTNNPAWLLMTIWSLLNIYFIRRVGKPEDFSKVQRLGIFLLSFGFIYIFLLPFGGYRSYRPVIIRYDISMPVTIVWIFFLLKSTLQLISACKNRHLQFFYAFVLIVFGSFFTLADKDLELNHHACQQKTLYQLQTSQDTLVTMPGDCNVGTWQTSDYEDPYVMEMLNEAFRLWHVIEPYQTVEVKKD